MVNDDGPLGPFSENFTFGNDLGCAFNVVCFVLFVLPISQMRYYVAAPVSLVIIAAGVRFIRFAAAKKSTDFANKGSHT